MWMQSPTLRVICCGGFYPAWFLSSHQVPQPFSTKEITQRSTLIINDWTINSGFFLTLITYINPLFLSMLSTWLGAFFSKAVTSCLFCGGAGLQKNGLSSSQSSSVLIDPPLLPVWLFHLYFLPACWPISV